MDYRKAIRPADLARMEQNWIEQEPVKGTQKEKDFVPVVRLHIPGTDIQWLLTELNVADGMSFGLCQIHYAELGYAWLPEIFDLDIEGLRVVQDNDFHATMTLNQYTEIARNNGGFLTL